MDPLEADSRRFGHTTGKKLDDLPEAQPSESSKSAIVAARVCPKCKTDEHTRLVSTSETRVWCVCGTNWPIAAGVLSDPMPTTLARGVSKQVIEDQTDYSVLDEDLDFGGPDLER